MYFDLLERELAQHCAPALCGLKPANLVSLSRRTFPMLDSLLAGCQAVFQRLGLCLETVCSCAGWDLVLVYQPRLLAWQLRKKPVRELLRRLGYPAAGELQTQISYLGQRLAMQEGFPHEIGLFLGYPVGDVLAFQRNQGKGCKLCGYWKVYGDVEAAQACFAQLDACRAALLQGLRSGKPLAQLVEAYRIHTA